MTLSAIFPGSFDPPTNGHVDIVNRLAPLFNPLYVAVGCNSSKAPPLFTPSERLKLLQTVFPLPQVIATSYDGLLVDYVKSQSIDIIIRAIRNPSDLDFELSQAGMNRHMTGVETLFVPADGTMRDISSTLVKEVGTQNGPIRKFVPPEIADTVSARLLGILHGA